MKVLPHESQIFEYGSIVNRSTGPFDDVTVDFEVVLGFLFSGLRTFFFFLGEAVEGVSRGQMANACFLFDFVFFLLVISDGDCKLMRAMTLEIVSSRLLVPPAVPGILTSLGVSLEVA